ncbi:MAG: diiron oxygenase [Polyangiales bacterium]
MAHHYSYESALLSGARASFELDSVLAPDGRFDFSLPFLPEGLAAARGASMLAADERLILNQLRGYSYLCLFGLVEEFILPFVLDHARGDLGGDDSRTRALLQFAGEEAKHIQLFKRFSACFERGFGAPCQVIGPARDVARVVLGHGPLGVALLILHIEWMTQRHYLEGVRDDGALEPQFKSLLRHHWMEEAQHAKLDTLIVEQLAAQLDERARASAVEEYLALVFALRDLLDVQLAHDLDALERARKRPLPERERSALREDQRRAVRWTFLGSGMTHPKFLATLDALSPDYASRVRSVAQPFCS